MICHDSTSHGKKHHIHKNTLDAPARPHVLRIMETKPSGVVLLGGSDAARKEEQVKNVAHCPLPILDTNMYPTRYFRGPSMYCRMCRTRHRATRMVLCDTCNARYHLRCLYTPLMRAPDEPWTCPRHQGMTHYPTYYYAYVRSTLVCAPNL